MVKSEITETQRKIKKTLPLLAFIAKMTFQLGKKVFVVSSIVEMTLNKIAS